MKGYLSVRETSYKWNVSERRVNQYVTKDNWYTTEEGIDRVLGELTRCGNQFVTDVKNYLK